MGSVYLRKGSKKYWIKYVQHGRVIRESTETENIADARRMLRTREGDIVKGIPVDPDAGRITFEEAVVDLLNDYSMNGKKTLDDVRRRIRKHLAPYFGNRRMVVITTADLRAYVAKRQAEGFCRAASAGRARTPSRRTRRRSAAQCRRPRSTASSRC